MQDENVACRDHSNTRSAVSERPNLNARLISQLERLTRFRAFSTTI